MTGILSIHWHITKLFQIYSCLAILVDKKPPHQHYVWEWYGIANWLLAMSFYFYEGGVIKSTFETATLGSRIQRPASTLGCNYMERCSNHLCWCSWKCTCGSVNRTEPRETKLRSDDHRTSFHIYWLLISRIFCNFQNLVYLNV